ncbi:MAG: chorismate-binding protein [Pontixanthobacter sp.]
MNDDGRVNLTNADAAFESLTNGQPTLVWHKVIADTETPVGAAAKLMEDGRGDFLLESVEGGEVRGRYSLLGLAPDLVFRASADRAEINRVWASDRGAFDVCDIGTLPALRALVAECHIDVPLGLPPALSVLVGYFGYETIGLVEKLSDPAQSPLDLPDMLFVRPTMLLVFDKLTEELFAIAPIWHADGNAAATLDLASRRIHRALAELNQAVPATSKGKRLAGGDVGGDIEHAITRADYAAMVGRAKEYIAAGDVFQVVLAQRFSTPFSLPPFALYRALRRVNPSPFLYFLDMPGFALVGSSPEILVRVRDGEVTVRPIAGTRPRGHDEAADARTRAELLADPKERAEHLMLLDLGRNDVGRVAERGSVAVTDSFGVEKYSHVMHIVSNVTGTLASSYDAIDALFAGFPAGTVSGAPKVRACQIIGELEPEARGAYAGGVGYFAPDGSIDSCIVLRTGVVQDGTLHVQAGAGIVADSNAAYEQRECEAKAGALFAAAEEAIRIAQLSEYIQ